MQQQRQKFLQELQVNQQKSIDLDKALKDLRRELGPILVKNWQVATKKIQDLQNSLKTQKEKERMLMEKIVELLPSIIQNLSQSLKQILQTEQSVQALATQADQFRQLAQQFRETGKQIELLVLETQEKQQAQKQEVQQQLDPLIRITDKLILIKTSLLQATNEIDSMSVPNETHDNS